ncbi:hypothetical protein [Vibrio phage phiKT1028]|nr:hypothetical protein [Vibrio phage phiKT1028]
MKVDLRPAEALFLTLDAAVKMLSNPESKLKELVMESHQRKYNMVLVDGFNPKECWFRDFNITLCLSYDSIRQERIALFTLRDEDLANHENVISIDISDNTRPLSEHWEALLRIMAYHYPETLQRIAESGDHIDRHRVYDEIDRERGLYKFCDFQKSQYESLVSLFTDLEEPEHD